MKISKLKLGLGVAIAAFFAVMPSRAFATVKLGTEDISNKDKNAAGTVLYDKTNKILTLNGYAGNITVNDQNITIKTGASQAGKSISKITVAGGSTVGQPVLTIDDSASLVTTGDIVVSHKAAGTTGIKLGAKLCAKGNGAEVVKSAGAAGSSFTTVYTVKGPVNLSASNCTSDKSPNTPETIDAVYIYVAVLVASSAIFAYRRHLAKR